MKNGHLKNCALAMLTVVSLSACQTDMEEGAVTQMPANPFPVTGFDANVSNAAVSACQNALNAQTQGGVEVVASEFSEANVTIYMSVGTQRAPCQCLVANDGTGPELMYLGSNG